MVRPHFVVHDAQVVRPVESHVSFPYSTASHALLYATVALSHLAVRREAVMLHYSLNVHHTAQSHDVGPQHSLSAGT